ncbi:SID1 transmembrane family member 1 [Armadillidium nasatum]|uniref:SID1 transmembrane family member 1 n=1 Tax=Armadillidium nasatum TaxID=96803 RepID=A0A5N5SIE5_9CRUS|nr:SID1 transmembrane family member 1 [Armadillidium nasatum]
MFSSAYTIFLILIFTFNISANIIQNIIDNTSLLDDGAQDYENCSEFVVNNGCDWTRKSSFLINSNHSCNFNCFYNPKDKRGPVRLSVHILSSINKINVFVSARQTHIISSWTLPITFEEHGKNQPYNSIEEVLCPPYKETNDDLEFRIDTSSLNPVNISVILTRSQIEVQLNTSVKVTATPVSPWAKLYLWQEDQESVLISAKSVGKSGGSVCTLLSIQNAKCPVGTNQADIMSGYGRYQSFQFKGGVIAKKSQFPDGVFIVILPLPDNRQCTGIEEDFTNKTSRSKTVEIIVLSHLTMDDKWGSFLGVGVVVAVVAIISLILISFIIRKNLMENKNFFEGEDEQNLLINEELPSGEGQIRREVSGGFIIQGGSAPQTRTPTRNVEDQSRENLGGISSNERRNDENFVPPALPAPGIQNLLLSLTEGNNAVIETSSGDLRIRTANEILDPMCSVRGIPEEATAFTAGNNPRFIYWWKILTEYKNKKPESNISEVFSYKGSEDQCFFNTLCITSFWIFPDFARMYTNIGYLLCVSVSRSYGLFQSLAWGLFIQGVMSSLYHVCPNRVTLRFDMMFMYVDAVILIVGIWGLRHGGVTHHVYPTVGLVGAALLGAEAKDWISDGLFWSVIVGVHLFFTFTISVMLCTLGTWSFSPVSMFEIWKDMKPVAARLKVYLREENVPSKSHITIIRTLFGIISNVAVMAVGPAIDMEVYLYILLVCIINMVLYTMNYVFTKVFVHQEKGTKIGWICMGLSVTLWIIALICFSVHNTNTETTPAVSREMNSECVLFDAFDSHDFWHLTSAFALFFSFVGILTMDDDLARRNPQKIPVF